MDLKINYEETRNTGKSVINYADEFKALLNDIHAQNENLKMHWQGADAASYTSKITEQEQTMNKLQKTIEEIGHYLVEVGNAYEKAMEENKLN